MWIRIFFLQHGCCFNEFFDRANGKFYRGVGNFVHVLLWTFPLPVTFYVKVYRLHLY